MALPIFFNTDKDFQLMQQKWASQLNPLLASSTSNPTILPGVVLKSGANVINTTQGSKTQGWFIADIDAPATIYRSAPLNNLTLTLTSSAAATVTLVLF